MAPAGGSWARRFLGVEPGADLYAIVLVYFVQGSLGLARLATTFYLKDDLGLDPASSAVVANAGAVPWLVKPLWGFVSDAVPLFGSRRRSYLVLCGLLGAAGWGAFATAVDSAPSAAAALALASLGTAAGDVVVDSVVVERQRGAPPAAAGALQSLCWGAAAVGGIVTAYFSGSLVEEYGPRAVFGATALFPLATAGAALLVREAPPGRAAGEAAGGARARVGRQARQLWGLVRQRRVWVPTAFVFLWQATPTCESALFYFQTNELGFDAEFLGRVRLLTAFASLLGVVLYNARFKEVPLKRMFTWAALGGFALGLTQLLLVTGLNRDLGVPDKAFALADSAVLTVLGQVAFMPVLVLAARVCPEDVEATLFAALMSVFNAGGVASGAAGAALTRALGVTADDFSNLALLVLLCNASSLLPLPFLSLLDGVEGAEEGTKDTEA